MRLFAGPTSTLVSLLVAWVTFGFAASAHAQSASEPRLGPIAVPLAKLASTCKDAEFFDAANNKALSSTLGKGKYVVIARALHCYDSDPHAMTVPLRPGHDGEITETITQRPWTTLEVRGREDCLLPEDATVSVDGIVVDRSRVDGKLGPIFGVQKAAGTYKITVKAPLHLDYEEHVEHRDAASEGVAVCMRKQPAILEIKSGSGPGAVNGLSIEVRSLSTGKSIRVKASTLELPIEERLVIEVRVPEGLVETIETPPLGPATRLTLLSALPGQSVPRPPTKTQITELKNGCHGRLGGDEDDEACRQLGRALVGAERYADALKLFEARCEKQPHPSTCLAAISLRAMTLGKTNGSWRAEASALCKKSFMGGPPSEPQMTSVLAEQEIARGLGTSVFAMPCYYAHLRDPMLWLPDEAPVRAGSSVDGLFAFEMAIPVTIGLSPLWDETPTWVVTPIQGGVVACIDNDVFCLNMGLHVDARVTRAPRGEDDKLVASIGYGFHAGVILGYPATPFMWRTLASTTFYAGQPLGIEFNSTVGVAFSPLAILELGGSISRVPVTLVPAHIGDDEVDGYVSGWRPGGVLRYSVQVDLEELL